MNLTVGRRVRGSGAAATLLVGGTALLRRTLRSGMGTSTSTSFRMGASVVVPGLWLATAVDASEAGLDRGLGTVRSFSNRRAGPHLATEISTRHSMATATTTTKATRAMSQLGTQKHHLHQQRRRRRRYRVFLAVGSNQGDSFRNIARGLELLCDPTFSSENESDSNASKDSDLSYHPTELVRSSFLYHTKPMYVTDQPSFWNGAVELDTDHDPSSLLKRLKVVEEHMGRDFEQIRNGPRPLDLDILLYYDNNNDNDNNNNNNNNNSNNDHEESESRATPTPTPVIVDTPDLVIPHRSLAEREFVLAPLIDVAGRNLVHPTIGTTSTEDSSENRSLGDLLDNLVGSDPDGAEDKEPGAVRMVPLPRERFLLFDRTLIMGILNVTPDSFSDGGKWREGDDGVERSVARALEMIDEGADIIDIGGESTRPGATEIEVGEQIRRTVPVVRALRERCPEAIVSIDTRHAAVAEAAVLAGADIVNDVSGGTFDRDMLPTVARLRVPIVLMHMRGTPESMQGLTDYGTEGGVVDGVTRALLERSLAAEEAGIPRWMQILDPGIGFAKDLDGNLSLLKHYSKLRRDLGDFPLLLGTSRKGFIGALSGETVAENRDFGTVGSCVAALCLGRSGTDDRSLGCNILRVHNVKGTKQATAVVDAIIGARG